MEFRELGKTGEKVSVVGMGTWGIGRYQTSEQRARQLAALRLGIQLGINLVDTAEMYHGGRSEELVGEATKEIRRDVFIATKVSPENLSHDSVVSACERSLGRLGTSYIDLYQVHWPNPDIPIRETMKAMEELVAAGKVRHVGVSNFNVEQTEEARQALSKVDVVSNQVEYSIANRAVEADILPYCSREGLSLIAYTPLNHGHIPSTDAIRAISQKYRMTPAQVALNWVTRDERVLAIPKAADPVHLQENARSISTRLSGPEYDQISRG